MSGMAAFMVAVGGTSLICFLLMNRGHNRNARRGGASDGTYVGAGSSPDGWRLFSWGGGIGPSHDSSSSSDRAGDSGGGGGDVGGGGGD